MHQQHHVFKHSHHKVRMVLPANHTPPLPTTINEQAAARPPHSPSADGHPEPCLEKGTGAVSTRSQDHTHCITHKTAPSRCNRPYQHVTHAPQMSPQSPQHSPQPPQQSPISPSPENSSPMSAPLMMSPIGSSPAVMARLPKASAAATPPTARIPAAPPMAYLTMFFRR